MAYGRREFELDTPKEDGSRLRDHAKSILKATGALPEEYQSLTCPSALEHCWHWFLYLNRTRSGSGFGQNPISYQEILAWTQLTGVEPDPTEIQAIMSLDQAYMNVQAQELSKRSQKK